MSGVWASWGASRGASCGPLLLALLGPSLGPPWALFSREGAFLPSLSEKGSNDHGCQACEIHGRDARPDFVFFLG